MTLEVGELEARRLRMLRKAGGRPLRPALAHLLLERPHAVDQASVLAEELITEPRLHGEGGGEEGDAGDREGVGTGEGVAEAFPGPATATAPPTAARTRFLISEPGPTGSE